MQGLTLKQLLRRCAWCGGSVPEGEFLGVSGRLLQPCTQPVIGGWRRSADRMVFAAVAPEGSQAKQSGADVVFALCSEPCRKALNEALKRDGVHTHCELN